MVIAVNKNLLIIVVLVVILSVMRFFMPTHSLSLPGSYEAVSHLFVGGLIGAWLVTKDKWYGFFVLFLSAVELTAFFTLKR
jgi:hypothetical protein